MKEKQNFLGELFHFYANFQLPVILCHFDLSIVYFNKETSYIFPHMKEGTPLYEALDIPLFSASQTAQIFYLPNPEHTPCMIHPLCDPLGSTYYVVEMQGAPSGSQNLLQDHKYSTFTAQLSHEMSTPLTMLCTSLSMIQKYSPQNDSKTQQYLTSATKYYYQLSRLVRHFLSLSKIYIQGKAALEPRTIDMVGFIRTICETFENTDNIYGVPLEFCSNTQDCLCDIDPFLIERVMLNLLCNAYKYTKADNIVTVAVNKNELHAIISISDRGIGMEPEVVAALLENFDGPVSQHSLFGHGIGLQIVKSYVEIHNGRVEAESTPGMGSTFRIYLPLSASSLSLKTPLPFELSHFELARLEEFSTVGK